MVAAPPLHPLELTPGVSVGPFTLGQTLFSTINLIRSDRHTYPHVKIAHDELVSFPPLVPVSAPGLAAAPPPVAGTGRSPADTAGSGPVSHSGLVAYLSPSIPSFGFFVQSPSTSYIHLCLSTPPLKLLFDGPSQRLCRVEVGGDSPGRWVTYRNQSLGPTHTGSDDPQEVVKLIRRVMGPTYNSSQGGGPGGDEVLSYPGVAFQVRKADGAVSELSAIVLTALPSPAGVSIEQAWLHAVLPDSPAVAEGDLKEVQIRLDSARKPATITLDFHCPPSSTPLVPIHLQLGVTTNEDLLCGLGSPIRLFWKEDDRMSIHAAPSSTDPALQPNGYFQSYPHLGLTFLVHPTSHTLAKVIVHSNLPGETQFGSFDTIARLLRGDATSSTTQPAAAASNGQHHLAPPSATASGNDSDAGSVDSRKSGSSGGKKSSRKGAGLTGRATPVLVMGGAGAGGGATGAGGGGDERGVEWERPMVLDRAADGEDGRDKQTELHGYPGLVLEVTEAGAVETLWLF